MSVAPSPFATLLRRSKFATFDPAIAQVYTTYGGSAPRGDWGLKRPLPIRRRGAAVTVRSVDSREQVTEWRAAEAEARWIARFAELGIESPRLQDTSGANDPTTWGAKLENSGKRDWVVDSEYALGLKDGADTIPKPLADEESAEAARKEATFRPATLPNIYGMGEKRFEKYLEQLRKKREEFKEFTAAERKMSLYEQSQRNDDWFRKFLQSSVNKSYEVEGSRAIEPQPHTFAGLSYTHAPPLQAYFLTKPLPGRLITKKVNKLERLDDSEFFIASFAGMTTKVSTKLSGGKNNTLMDGKEQLGGAAVIPMNVAKSETKLRLSHAYLAKAPEVVGPRFRGQATRKEGLKGVVLQTHARGYYFADVTRPNPHLPGSAEYVSAEDDSISAGRPMKFQARFSKPPTFTRKPIVKRAAGKDGAKILDLLANVLKSTPSNNGK
ncbi:hypothetical protein JAAARDRAFT_32188 [Jaapia argillacea MUCL 33604]|uniref:Mitochondrial ribosomal protein MRP51 n=1 Tax=Jaapia argillacea MUCL 33604 TaxID=933084 RepID=A0A067QEZ1_9AGAM|nr:hypothetical protein JAAARDRAFT_32188 [Jaapia argillacea MUCL 33604]